jgi:hypothetical protein
VELSDALAGVGRRRAVIVQQVFDLMFEVREIGFCGQTFGWDTNSPFGGTPGVRIMQAERFVHDLCS